MKGLSYEVKNLLHKARESSLLAIETYNRPTASFRSGAYIVLMNIAWTSLFLSIFSKRNIKPYHRKPNSTRYVKIDGEPKWWELKECLNQFYKSENPPLRKNLEFFIALRNKIEHCSMSTLDPELFGECQAMLLNFESLLISEYGAKYAINGGLTMVLQFSKDVFKKSSGAFSRPQDKTFKNIKRFVDTFRSNLSADVQSSLEYSFKVYLVPKIGNQASGDAIAVEWIKYDPAKPEEMKEYDKVVAMIKPKETRVGNLGLLKPSQVVAQVANKLGKKFTMYDHTLCCQHFNIRPTKGVVSPSFCDTRYCQYDDLHKDYCYDPAWVDFLVNRLSDSKTFDTIIQQKKAKGKANLAIATNNSKIIA